MKCPKCGNKKVICFLECPEHSAYCECYECNIIFDFDEKQSKLDKVLSKFEQSGNNYYLYAKDDYVALAYIKKIFYLVCGEYNEISLETVEHIIKDLKSGK